MAKKNSNWYALLHFYEEKSFCVMRKEDCVPNLEEKFDLSTWDRREVIEVLWDNGSPYPAYLLQFGENKKSMERLVDDLIAGSVLPDSVPLLQDLEQKRRKGNQNSSVKLTNPKMPSTKGKSTDHRNFFKDVRKNMTPSVPCVNCKSLEKDVIKKGQEMQLTKKELEETQLALLEAKRKYKEMKLKYKEKKRIIKQMKEESEKECTVVHEEMYKFGEQRIPQSKLALCRSDYSKYVGDLLDICFGRETLCESVLKTTTNKRSIKTNILDEKTVNDIMSHVIQKFNSSVSVGMVRAAIRQKLNTCHKSMLRNKS